MIKQVINPLYGAAPENKAKFSVLYDKISEAGTQNHQVAQSILAITDITSDADIDQLQQQLQKAKEQGDPLATEILKTIEDAVKHDEVMHVKTPLLLLANPVSAKRMTERQAFTDLHDTVSQASQTGNELATALLNVTDGTTDEEITKLKTQIDQAASQKDATAALVLEAIDTYQPSDDTSSDVPPTPAAPTQPPVQDSSAQQPQMPGMQTNQQTAQPNPAEAYPVGQAQQPMQQVPFGMSQPQPMTPPPAPAGMAMNMPTAPIQQNGGYYQPVQDQTISQQVVEPMGSGPVMQPPFQNQPYNQTMNNQTYGSPLGMQSAANLKEEEQV